MQHQELLVYDIKHLLCDLYKPDDQAGPTAVKTSREWRRLRADCYAWLWRMGIRRVGTRTQRRPDETTEELQSFAFDNEKPAHQVFLSGLCD